MPVSNHLPPEALLARMRTARRLVVLTGAGMSAESGIPTFRDKRSGLWARFDLQRLATPEAFSKNPSTVWAWYESRRRLVAEAVPNAGHLALAALAMHPRITSLTIVTQNVDNLHERAGSNGVLHLHGSLFAVRCADCGRPFDRSWEIDVAIDASTQQLDPPRCLTCGGRIRPGVVWFGERLPEAIWLSALEMIAKADLLLVVGTSSTVYPVASLPETARRLGCEVAIINPNPSTLVSKSPLDWQVSAATGLPKLMAALAA
jgi:NAD-dependent deacetylase